MDRIRLSKQRLVQVMISRLSKTVTVADQLPRASFKKEL